MVVAAECHRGGQLVGVLVEKLGHNQMVIGSDSKAAVKVLFRLGRTKVNGDLRLEVKLAH